MGTSETRPASAHEVPKVPGGYRRVPARVPDPPKLRFAGAGGTLGLGGSKPQKAQFGPLGTRQNGRFEASNEASNEASHEAIRREERYGTLKEGTQRVPERVPGGYPQGCEMRAYRVLISLAERERGQRY